MDNIFTYKKGFTHAGKFHADDVFSTAFLQILNPDIEISRGFQVPEGFDGIVYDIGMGEFDHHQKDSKIRRNGIPFAAFGLLWERFAGLLLDEDQAREMEQELVMVIDLSDNSAEKNPLSTAISWMNPAYDQTDRADEFFWKAVDFAKGILEAGLEKYRKVAEATRIVKNAMKKCDGKTLILDAFCPWKDAVKGSRIDFVVFPSNRGGYNTCAVPSEEDPKIQKIRFPESLGGQTPAELERITGIKGLQFCHPGGFICAAESLESAIAIAEWTRKNG